MATVLLLAGIKAVCPWWMRISYPLLSLSVAEPSMQIYTTNESSSSKSRTITVSNSIKFVVKYLQSAKLTVALV